MGIFRKKDDMGNKGSLFGKGPKKMKVKYDNVPTQEGPEQPYQMTDEEYYDRGDYERSYGTQKRGTVKNKTEMNPNKKYGHPEKPAAYMKMEHASQKRMGDMVAKVYGKPMPPSQQRTPTKAEEKQQYTTSGMPKNLYTESGEAVDTKYIDEGNLSAIHRVHKSGPYVSVQDDTERFNKGTKLFLKNPMAASQYKMPPAQNKRPSRAQARADAAKKEAEARAARGKK